MSLQNATRPFQWVTFLQIFRSQCTFLGDGESQRLMALVRKAGGKIVSKVGQKWGKLAQPIKKASTKILANACFYWCPGPESNRHEVKLRGILSPLRLPIPPPGRWILSTY
ncbi:hypothetical protein DESC_240058 [Desulfosarcina cetonica]|nr:hypothetical protein DESC_240058 [Desulfosarcina cetonica]